jgi:hypothetical protein
VVHHPVPLHDWRSQRRIAALVVAAAAVAPKKVVKTTLCTTGGAQLLPKYSSFLEGVLELLSRDILRPLWKYDIGRIFKITRQYSKKILLCVRLYTFLLYVEYL